MDTLEKISARKLELNDVAVCNISTARPLVATPYADNKTLGSFILIDRLTNETVGAGMIDYALRGAQNVHWQSLTVTKERRAAAKAQQPCCLWFTGLSGSGKSTVANILETRLQEMGAHTYILDGDNVRHGLNRDLGFTDADRVENIPPRRRGRPPDDRRGPHDAGLVHLALPRRAPTRPRTLRGQRVHRDLHRHAPRGLRAARPQGPLQEGPRRRDRQLHGYFFALQAPPDAQPGRTSPPPIVPRPAGTPAPAGNVSRRRNSAPTPRPYRPRGRREAPTRGAESAALIAATYRWNRPALRALLAGPAGPPVFCWDIDRAIESAAAARGAVYAWASRLETRHETAARSAGVPLFRIEDGFLRAIGLGAGFVTAASLAIDSRDIYYDATRPSAASIPALPGRGPQPRPLAAALSSSPARSPTTHRS